LTPTIPSPLVVATTKPRPAARLQAGAVEATPTTTFDTSPRAPLFRPLSDAVSGKPIGAVAVASELIVPSGLPIPPIRLGEPFAIRSGAKCDAGNRPRGSAGEPCD
jgi:hypothetical protein